MIATRASSALFAASPFLVAAALWLAACSSDSTDTSRSRVPVLTDALGDTLRIGKPIERVVSLAPSITELVYALGEEHCLVGVTEYCDYPPEAQSRPRVAGFNAINLEAIVGVRPDLVLASRGNLPEDLAAIRQVHIPVFAFQIESLAALLSGIETLGVIVGAEARADSLRRSWQERIARVEAAAGEAPGEARPRVFFGGISEPIYSVGPGSFVHNLIVIAGGRNIFDDVQSAWPRIDLETLVKRDPDVLFVGYHAKADTASVLARLRAAPGWRSLSAVRKGEVLVLGDEVMRPGPRLIDALEEISRALYPTGGPRQGVPTRSLD